MNRSDEQTPLTERKTPEGGYRLIPVREIAGIWFLHRAGCLRFADIRAYLACHEAVTRRCTGPSGKAPKFTPREIMALTGGNIGRVNASLARLESLGVLSFSESAITFANTPPASHLSPTEFGQFLERFPNHNRLLPVPRRTLRLLCGGARAPLAAVMLGHLVWGLYRVEQGAFRSVGRVKSSWIAETFSVAMERVEGARAHLVDMGWLLREESSRGDQDRFGAKFSINLSWKRAGITSAQETSAAAPDSKVADARPAHSALDKEPPPGGRRDQEPASRLEASGPEAVGGQTGVKISESKETGAGESKPTLKHIVPQDLRETARLLELHAQAVDSGLLGSSECDQLHFFAAAEHARVIGTENPCGLFARLVRSKLWHYLTQDDEDTANRRLKDFLHVVPMGLAGGLIVKPAPVKEPELSEDARLVRAVKAALLKAGYRGDPFPQFRREKPEWTRERWDQAVRELERQDSRRKSMTSVGELLDLEENL